MSNAFQSDAFQQSPAAFQEGGGPATIWLDLLDAGPALFAFALTFSQTSALPLLDGSAALYAPGLLNVSDYQRVTQVAVEVLVMPDNAQVRVSQLAVEVLRRTYSEGGSQVIIVGM